MPDEVMDHEGLGPTDMMIMADMVRLSDMSENRDGYFYYSNWQGVKLLRVSENTVLRVVKRLGALGLIDIRYLNDVGYKRRKVKVLIEIKEGRSLPASSQLECNIFMNLKMLLKRKISKVMKLSSLRTQWPFETKMQTDEN